MRVCVDSLVHSRCVPWEVKAEWTAEVFCKRRENMMVLNLALGRLQGPHHCTVVIIAHTHTHTHTHTQTHTALQTITYG